MSSTFAPDGPTEEASSSSTYVVAYVQRHASDSTLSDAVAKSTKASGTCPSVTKSFDMKAVDDPDNPLIEECQPGKRKKAHEESGAESSADTVVSY